MQNVLLLNASYEPLNIISIKKAFKLWALEKIIFIEQSDEEWNSQYLSIKLPLIVRLKEMVKHRQYIKPRLSRRNFYIRDNHTCQYCGKKDHAKYLTLDHIHPRALGGVTAWKNVVTACRTCNQRKEDLSYKDAQEQLGMELINGKPKKPDQMLLTARLKYGYNLPQCWGDYMYS
jgi:5-methylcytosine-specific restriction endonuclease McrA